MISFVMDAADLLLEEFHTNMLRDDMTLARLMVYAQSIEESKLGRIAINIKRRGSSDQIQPLFKKRVETQDGSSTPEVKLEKGSRSQSGKPTCATCGKNHYGKCLVGTVIALYAVVMDTK